MTKVSTETRTGIQPTLSQAHIKRSAFSLKACGSHFSLPLGLSLLLSACGAADLATGVPSDALQRAQVELVRLDHLVSAEEDGTDTPSMATYDSLYQFFTSVNAGYGDTVVLDAAETVSEDRLTAIENFIRARGLTYGGVRPLGQAPDQGEVILYVERHIVIPPTCGHWTQEASSNRRNNTSAYYGCATARNLAITVASPRDLIDGARGGTNGGAAVAAIQQNSKELRRGLSSNDNNVRVTFESLPGLEGATAAAPSGGQ